MSSKLGKRKRIRRQSPVIKDEQLAPFEKGWYKQQKKNDRELFEYSVIFLGGLLLAWIWAIFEYDYPGVHKALAFYCLLTFLLSLLRRGDMHTMITNTKKVYVSFNKSTIQEINDALFFVIVVISLFTILFVINLDILSNAGYRIGAAAAFGLFVLMKQVINSFKN